jgi:antitoxin component YwqK of YwqJK toxin-antitoxin module
MHKIKIWSFIMGTFFLGMYFIYKFLPILLFAPCDGNGEPNGDRVYRHKNGNLQYITKVKSCYTDGFQHHFHENGMIKEISYYNNFYPDSALQQQEGPSYHFTEKGILYQTYLFHKGKLLKTTTYDTTSLKVISEEIK